MDRRRFLAAVAGLAALPLIGCGAAKPLRIGIHAWIGYETLYLARTLNWLPSSVQLVSGSSATDSLTGLRLGELEAACLTLDEVLLARSQGVPLTIATVFNVSAGADMLVVRPGIQRLEQLAGKRLGVESSALGALMLNRILHHAGLSRSAVRLVELAPDQQLAAWQAGRVEAVITYEPTAGRLLELGAERLFDSRSLPDTIFDVLAVRADLAGASPLTALVNHHFRALEHIRTNRQDALYRIAGRQQISPARVEQALAGVVMPGLMANRRYLEQPDSRLAQAARQLHDVMLDHGLLRQPDRFQQLFSPRWLPEERG
ncbi:substrate-binding protein involved in nitrate/sulfonate/bicarbonate ABC transporter [Oceanimonas sp. GK1]|uniref:ABC transporter substrate-binding protein n=1 Tax=Oceanimonas sp. (strain GK1 / IBRC-M 10197) TaxID=511062 RepID=UPI0002495037|nr:ABC transporter substrate-binding protein [Oceanimonas sp. GK1]AEY01760.1 substrate-binding protein involved in nitrate/sulfonate/bicarbonate ABC transporter [Oceanimonas sp. GK1]